MSRAMLRAGGQPPSRARLAARLASTTRDVLARDRAIAGGELAGALAYRIFLWFLPFVLLLVGGLGIYADASEETPEHVAGRLGLAGLVVHSVSAAARSDARWYALVVGVLVLLYVTVALLRTTVAVHRLAWQLEPRRGYVRPVEVLRFFAAAVAFLAVAAGVSAAVASTEWAWVAIVPISIVLRGAVWLAVSRRLPHRECPWTALLPGAAFVGAGLLAVNAFTAVIVAQLAARREDAYGALGIAAAVLFSLWLTSRVIVVSAVVNAVLSRRREARS